MPQHFRRFPRHPAAADVIGVRHLVPDKFKRLLDNDLLRTPVYGMARQMRLDFGMLKIHPRRRLQIVRQRRERLQLRPYGFGLFF